MVTPLSSFRPITPGLGTPGAGLFDMLPQAPNAALPQNGLPGGDTFQLGGRGFIGSPCGGGQAGLTEADIAQLVQVLASLMGAQGGQGLAPANACGAPAPAPIAAPANPCAPVPLPMDCRNLGALGSSPWGNLQPLVNSPLAGINGQLGAQPAPNAMAQRALDFSAAQMNPATANAINPNTGVSQAQDPNAWSNWCLAFVSAAYGYQVPELRAATAFDSYQNFAAQGRIQQDRNPPAGAPVFFNKTPGTPYGHVGIATGKLSPEGDPIIRTTGSEQAPGIFEVPLSQLEKVTAQYLGWGRI